METRGQAADVRLIGIESGTGLEKEIKNGNENEIGTTGQTHDGMPIDAMTENDIESIKKGEVEIEIERIYDTVETNVVRDVPPVIAVADEVPVVAATRVEIAVAARPSMFERRRPLAMGTNLSGKRESESSLCSFDLALTRLLGYRLHRGAA